jgi:hypothetical protein
MSLMGRLYTTSPGKSIAKSHNVAGTRRDFAMTSAQCPADRFSKKRKMYCDFVSGVLE